MLKNYGDKQPVNDQPEVNVDIPTWALLIMTLTAIVYYVSMFKIQYGIGSVIGTLAIVEEPETTLVETETFEDDVDKKATDPLLEQQVVVLKSKPVTSKIRTARALLKAQGGRASLFRGFSLYVVHALLRSVLILVLADPLPGHLLRALAIVVAEVILSPLQMAWVHIVISKSSSEPWYKRIPSGKWSKIAPAALLNSLAFQVALQAAMTMLCIHPVAKKFADDPSSHLDKRQVYQAVLAIVSGIVVGITSLILLCVPAHVTFVRVAASMLPEGDDTIVPFDRTFGGKVVPVALGGTGQIGVLDAWRTFAWEARRRYMGLMLKTGAIMVATTVLFTVVMIGQVAMFTETASRENLAKLLRR
ncbi:hypothetical protein UCRPC4_g05406 [Phaeomoniella chlamydospora]|uniref:Ubiquitin carrier protein n=1 Tax=Phaeomoniella chlamydospora TaxID=158046 RepID=A0A0G2G1G9_PHACM|nr:hypothetical protein UCRPC4_g05406 [Phaeomoniella chlamydospora]